MTNLFPTVKGVKVSQQARNRLLADLKSWRQLSRHLKDTHTVEHLKRLIVVEHGCRNRPDILKRLIARLHTTERKALFEKLKIP